MSDNELQEFYEALDAFENEPLETVCMSCRVIGHGSQKRLEAQGWLFDRRLELCGSCGWIEIGRRMGRVERNLEVIEQGITRCLAIGAI